MFEDWQRQGGIADEVSQNRRSEKRQHGTFVKDFAFFFFFNTLGKTGNPSKIEDLKNGREMLLQPQYVRNYTMREQGWKQKLKSQ